MLRKLYTLFIAPRQQHEDTRNRELVLNVLLSSTLAIILLSLPLFLHAYLILHEKFALGRMLWVLVVLSFVGSLYGLSRSGRYRNYRIAAFLLLAVYFFLAAVVVLEWGVTIPVGILLFGLVVVLSGILLGSVYSLYAAAAVAVFLLIIHKATMAGLVKPDLSWTVDQPRTADVVGFSLIFGILAVVSWLFNFQMERSLKRAKRAEAALRRQKASLEDTVIERTRQLQAEQLEKVQQMYRFAELGQLSTALLHELANHLTTITLDIEGLETKKTNMLGRTKRSIRYIDNMVHRVRDQLHGKSSTEHFNVATELDDVVSILQHKAAQSRVRLLWQMPSDKKSLRCRGDSLRFRQLLANLISNAIEAYGDVEQDQRREVEVSLSVRGKQLVVTVNDWGKGIPKPARNQLFEPFFGTKQTGMGLGLFVAKKIAEEHLGGKLALDTAKPYTSFKLQLPRVGS